MNLTPRTPSAFRRPASGFRLPVMAVSLFSLSILLSAPSFGQDINNSVTSGGQRDTDPKQGPVDKNKKENQPEGSSSPAFDLGAIAAQLKAVQDDLSSLSNLLAAVTAQAGKAESGFAGLSNLLAAVTAQAGEAGSGFAASTNQLAAALAQMEKEREAVLNQLYDSARVKLAAIAEQAKDIPVPSSANPPVPPAVPPVAPDAGAAESVSSLSNAVDSLSRRIPEDLSATLGQLARADRVDELAEAQKAEVVGRLRLLVILVACALVMLVALGAVMFLGFRNPEPPAAARPKQPGGSDAPSDWRAQLAQAREAELQAKRDAQSARDAEQVAKENASAAREAKEKALASIRQSGDAAAEAQAAVRAALSAFASSRGLDENAWLTALRDIARELSKVSAARGASPKDGLELLAKWSRILSEFLPSDRKIDLNLPAIGDNVDTSWMTPARAGAAKVSRVLTWAVFTKNGVRHNAEVE